MKNYHRQDRKKIICFLLSIIAILALLITSCTSTPDLWYKTGASQNDFNLNSKECVIIAKRLSLQQSETGKRIDPAIFSNYYLQCINSKGWSRNKPVSDATDQSTVPPPQLNIKQDGTTLNGFGLHVTLPDNFTLVNSQQTAIYPTILQQFYWQDGKNTFINVIFQQNNQTRFDITPYPISEPYQLYTSGVGEKTKSLLQWSTYFGQIQDKWVMGLGSFYMASENERLIIVISKDLDPPSSTPPANLSLSRNQYQQIEEFSNQWGGWLESQFPEKEPGKNWLKELTRLTP